MKLGSSRNGGYGAMCGAIAAVIGNGVVLAASPNAPADVVSYPLSAQDFRLGQIFFAGTQALMTLGILALVRSGAGGTGRRARVCGGLALAGFVITVIGELVLAGVASSSIDSAGANAASTVFGLGVLVADIGLIGFGLSARRAGVWPRGWATLPLLLGAFQLVVVTPVVMGAGFASVAAFLGITVQALLVAAVGWRLTLHGRVTGAVDRRAHA